MDEQTSSRSRFLAQLAITPPGPRPTREELVAERSSIEPVSRDESAAEALAHVRGEHR
jgi:hypothetical protein